MAFDFAAFEAQLYDELHGALARFAKRHRTHTFYAVALYGVYRERDARLSLPALAASSESGGPPREEPSTFWGPRFNPPEWPYDIDLRAKPARRLEAALTAEATRGSDAHWGKTEAKYMKLLVRIARRLRDAAPLLLKVTDDFVCFWFDEEGGHARASESISASLSARLFAGEMANQVESAAIARKPPGDRAAFLVTRFGVFEGVSGEDAERELLGMGARAIDALVSVLPDLENGWQAAKLLGNIGVANAVVVKGLRTRAADEQWYAMALGMLGDHAWLAKQKPGTAINGLVAPLKAITQGGDARALDYTRLETYLDAVPAARKLAEEELEPGSSFVSIVASDVDEAVRALASKHAVVRWHAASVLGERSLGPAAGKKLLPALAAVLGDRNAIVRRFAVLSLSYWKAAARPYHPAIRALRNDSDPVVRSVASSIPAK